MITLGLHVLNDLLPAAWHHHPGHVGLDADHLDVNTVPWYGLEDLVLRPLYVQYEPVDCGIVHGQQQGVQGDTLQGQGRG